MNIITHVNFVKQIVVVVLCLFALLYLGVQSQAVFAQLQLPGAAYDGYEYFNALGVVDVQSGSVELVDAVQKFVNLLRAILFPVIAALVTYIGVRIIFANGNEDEIKKYTSYFVYIVIGIGFLAVAQEASKLLSLGGAGGTGDGSFLSQGKYSEAGRKFGDIIDGFVTFARYLLGGIAVFFSIKSGALLIFANSDEGEVTKQKEVFLWGTLGFVIIMISTTLVDKVIFPVDPVTAVVQPSVSKGIALIVDIINLVLGILGGLAVISLVAGGVLYAASAGNTERSGKASKLIYGSLIGLIIAYSSYTIVAEFIPTHRTIGQSAPDFDSDQQLLEGGAGQPGQQRF